jgi:flagellar basal-body rod protein FlgC
MIKILLSALMFCGIFYANASEGVKSAQKISQSGMQIQSERMKVIAQNIANSNSIADNPNEDPYRRKILNIKQSTDNKDSIPLLVVDEIKKDQSDFNLKYEPSNPAARADGYVRYPNVDINMEIVDAKEAQLSFEANLSAYEIAKSNHQKLLEAMK